MQEINEMLARAEEIEKKVIDLKARREKYVSELPEVQAMEKELRELVTEYQEMSVKVFGGKSMQELTPLQHLRVLLGMQKKEVEQ